MLPKPSVRTSLNELPNELLERIFWLANSSPSTARATEDSAGAWEGDSVAAVRISHVCRLWRYVSLSLPKLWSFINLSMPDDAADAFGERSGTERLSVLYRDTTSGETTVLDRLRFERLALAFVERIKVLHLELLPTSTLVNHIGTVTFPQMRELVVNRVKPTRDLGLRSLVDCRVLPFPDPSPTLCRLTIQGVFLEHATLLAAMRNSQLTHLTLSRILIRGWNTGTFYAGIAGLAPSLVQLHIDLDGPFGHHFSLAEEKVDLPRLEWLKLKIGWTRNVLGSLRTPARITADVTAASVQTDGVVPDDLSALGAFARVRAVCFRTTAKDLLVVRGFAHQPWTPNAFVETDPAEPFVNTETEALVDLRAVYSDIPRPVQISPRRRFSFDHSHLHRNGLVGDVAQFMERDISTGTAS